MYTASIDIIDKDYRAYAGSEFIKVNSWEEAEKYCKENSWSGLFYVIHSIRDCDKVYFSKKHWNERLLNDYDI